MKYLILSDIHGNMKALNKVLDYVSDESYEKIISLGDLVGGDNPEEILEWAISQNNLICVLGNHDESYLELADNIPREIKEWLNGVPLSKVIELEGKKILLVHAEIDSNIKIPILYDGYNLQNFFEKYRGDWEYVLFGHTHQQCLLTFPEEKTLINPGSVGISYDNKISFALLNINNGNIKVEFIKIDRCF